MTDLGKELSNNGFILDPETGRFAVDRRMFEKLVRVYNENLNSDRKNEAIELKDADLDFSAAIGGSGTFDDSELRRAVFTASGDNRITEAHHRITNETKRINALREGLTAIRDNLAGTDRAVTAHNDRISAVEGHIGTRLLERITALENGSRLVGTGDLIAEIMARITKLEDGSRLDRFAVTLDEMGDRVRRSESQTQFETSEDDARIKALEHKVDWIQEAGASAQGEVDRRLGGLEQMMTQVFLRMEAYGIPHHGTVKVPEMATQGTESDFTKDRRLTTDVLTEAADRLREWMKPAFNPSTIDAAVRVVRGENGKP